MRGATLIELLSVLVIVGTTTAVSVPPLARGLDRTAVAGAADRYAALHETARHLAIARSRLTRLSVDTLRGRATVEVRATASGWDTVRVADFGKLRISASQTATSFSPLGIGFGLANGRLVFSRGDAADTITISRTGRLTRR